MNTSGEAADQVVRMSLEVGEAALKISGAGAKHFERTEKDAWASETGNAGAFGTSIDGIFRERK